ncbi:hypothetical protein ACERK3_14575 [Phycisphaerales bacterium AB-hyl4]|uniref:Uncharacterized protein n=1 Tax=Natronomicrosphaera hydrolytica TaxID=3242702 RepID=A0ABV4U7M0_9BACT
MLLGTGGLLVLMRRKRTVA